ncbi:hypothetical protein [Actinomadura sp. 9N407]|uniref:hypothetical protein n=1 Tax=Actinomadura sp. 9N407 TaxID=3375154 RepID=UPI00379983E6
MRGHVPRASRTAQDLARYGAMVREPLDVQHFTSSTPHGLDLLRTGSTSDLHPTEYDTLSALVERSHAISLIDAGSGRTPVALTRAAEIADRMVVTGLPTAVQRMPLVLDWLRTIGRADLAASAMAILMPESDEQMRARLRATFPHVLAMPHDPHLAQGGVVDPALVSVPVKDILLEIAAVLL